MNSLNKTFLPNLKYETRNWFIIDCKGQHLGRLATTIVTLLKGKLKPHYYPSTDIGDYVILLNADSIIINKQSKHFIVNNPGRPGNSLKIRSAIESVPEFTIERAVKGMLSRTETKRLIKRLNIYSDENHPHSAQNPIKLDDWNWD
uniref:ribosomal protein L13 n=1 Tax=Thalassionema bacillare TaxID=426664 RepID=UPI001EE11F94|nr:ribosomal protein L13 [Thalassionema bacillare]UHY40431.1 ribosomal protein L13 [Thalassionema bacillare]UHY40818.1 ribosomal protein L13 [Thalassionema bacillare]UHY41076.1 ribosomal protein L13 [Thalassionema bacillare]